MTGAWVAEGQSRGGRVDTIHAAKRGGPYLNLADGQIVESRYQGAPASALHNGSAVPLSLASADFDEDGMPDLAGGYASGGSGVITIHRGNVNALWPYGEAIRHGDPPAFLPDVRVVELPEQPDFLGAGDFDADGHWDLVAAKRGSSALWFLRGDGQGGFYAAERVPLPAGVTALATGELNRPDGLTDIAVALAGSGAGAAARVMVFESPGGALRGDPETFRLPAAASALAVTDLDGDSWNDLAVGAGKELLIVHSRDRKLSLPKSIRSQVPAATVTTQSLPFVVRSLAAGSFASHKWTQLAAFGDDGKVHLLERPAARQIASASLAIPGRDGGIHTAPGKHSPESNAPRPGRATADSFADLAIRGEIDVPGLGSAGGASLQLIAARVSAGGTHDLIVIDGGAHKLHIISKDRDGAEPAVKLAASLDSSAAPIAALPMRLHPHPLSDLMVLTSGRPEPQILHPEDVVTFVVTNTADSGPGSLRAAINGSTQSQGASSIVFNIPTTDPNYDPVTHVFTITPIGVLNGFNNVINAEPLLGGASVTVDAYTQPGASANTLINGDNAVLKIRIDGARGGQGSIGLQTFEGTTDTIRGFIVTGFTQPLQVSANENTGGTGIEPDGGNDFIEGNFVGTNSTGTAALPNYNGVLAFGSSSPTPGDTIGGTTPQARNLISGNSSTGFGSALVAEPNTFFVQGNYIGTDASGAHALPNGQGAGGAGQNIVIGGTVAGASNLISGNNSSNVDSVTIASNTFGSSYIVQGNLIGTDYTGAAAIANPTLGVIIGSNGHIGNQFPTALNNTIGGTTPAARNIISGNSEGGILISDGADTTLVQGNYIGLDVSGARALANGSVSNGDGIFNGVLSVFPNSTPPANTTIGGEFPGSGNVISANFGNGIQIVGLGQAVRGCCLQTFGNTVEGNFIGTDASGVNALPNHANGIYVNGGAGLNLIGDPGGASGNLIAFNTLNGVLVDPGTGTPPASTGNSVTGNTIFSNNGAGVRMPSGTDSPISRNSIYLNGALGIDTASAGPNAMSACSPANSPPTLLQNAPLLVGAAGTTIVTATATDASGNTSEFSNCAPVTPVNNVITVTGTLTATERNTTYTVELFQNDSCDPSGFGQGKHYLTNLSLTTDSSCTTPILQQVDLSKADLSVTLTGYQFPTAGSSLTLNSVVSNLGAANATNVVYTAQLPSGITFASATITSGACATSSGTVTCTIGNLASGASVNIALTTTVTARTAGTLTPTASVTATQVDPNTGNNTASLAVHVSIPFPQITSFTPAYLLAGSPDSMISIVGSGFFPGSTVTFNGVTLNNVTYVNSTTLNVIVPAALLTNYGSYPVVVTNGPDEFQSSTLNFFVRVACTFTLSPPSVALSAAGTQSATFNVTAPAGCMWFAQGDFTSNVVSATTTTTDADGDLIGSGTVTYSMPADSGAPRIDIVKILPTTPEACFLQGCGPPLGTESDFTIYQGGAFNCTFSLPVSSVNVPAAGVVGEGFNGQGTGAATFFVNVSDPACIPSATTNVTWITQQGSGGSTDQWEEDYNVGANSGAARTGQIIITGLASVTGSTPNIVTLPFTVNQAGATGPTPASVTATGGTPQTTGVGMTFGTMLSATVKDSGGNVLSGVTVSFSAPATGASAMLSASSAVTNAAGVASVTATANGTPGSYSVTATVSGVSSPAIFALTNSAAAAANVTASGGTPQSTPINTAFSSPLQATVTDSVGNPLSGVTVTFTAPTSGASATLTTSTAVTNASGVASTTATANGTTGSYSVTASVSGVSTPATFSLTNSGSPTVFITATSGTPQTAALNTAFTNPLVVTVKDASNNPISGITVTFTAPASGAGGSFAGTGTTATAVTSNSGIATSPVFTANGAAGSYNVAATVAGAATAANFALTNSVAGATSLGGAVAGKSGPPNARVWVIEVGNEGPGSALNTQITSMTIVQTSGPACSPVITTPFPLAVGNIAPHAVAQVNVTFNFTGCAATASFTVTAFESANNGAATGTIVRLDEFQ